MLTSVESLSLGISDICVKMVGSSFSLANQTKNDSIIHMHYLYTVYKILFYFKMYHFQFNLYTCSGPAHSLEQFGQTFSGLFNNVWW